MANLSSQEQLGALLERWGHRARTPSAVGTPRPVTLTVGIATYNDFDGAYFTAHSLLLHHPEAMRDAEIVILDNHPEGSEAPSLAAMAADHPGSAHVRYVPYDAVRSTAVRDALFREAAGEVVLVLDSHVLLAPGGLESLIAFLQAVSALTGEAIPTTLRARLWWQVSRFVTGSSRRDWVWSHLAMLPVFLRPERMAARTHQAHGSRLALVWRRARQAITERPQR